VPVVHPSAMFHTKARLQTDDEAADISKLTARALDETTEHSRADTIGWVTNTCSIVCWMGNILQRKSNANIAALFPSMVHKFEFIVDAISFVM